MCLFFAQVNVPKEEVKNKDDSISLFLMFFTMVEENFNLFFWSRSFVKSNTKTHGMYAHSLLSCSEEKKKAFFSEILLAMKRVVIGHFIQNSEKAL